ncbi:protein of unknown function [Syntrophus gentianae]|uniref:DUF2703 domain-containing protein n=1 Tax=Syntrophus gentianae TaxID=43775 RepID=A0A1H7ZYH3_9BACT|nr:DUF2703 domain-containing protein [Syntrophus gentianae]SEM63333.1 protein of unknown function [Syntrophus gentianae]
MKTLTIRWKRLVDGQDQTCPRCGATGETVRSAVDKLKKALAELGIEVLFKTETLDFPMFSQDSLQSNRIWIGEKPLEEWIGATVGQSPCCGVCGDSDCRTLSIGNNTYEEIPERLIVQAGLLAAAELYTD